VTKATYNGQDLVEAIYVTQGVPLSVRLSPAGIEREPNNMNELTTCVTCILEFLSSLHNKGWVHRDVRWPNILYVSPSQWIVIDLDLASEIGDEPSWKHKALHRETAKGYLPRHDLYQLAIMMEQVSSLWSNNSKFTEFVEKWKTLHYKTGATSLTVWKSWLK